jgi:nitrate reductase gamma subunit
VIKRIAEGQSPTPTIPGSKTRLIVGIVVGAIVVVIAVVGVAGCLIRRRKMTRVAGESGPKSDRES